MGGYICNLLASNYLQSTTPEEYLISALERMKGSREDCYTLLYHAIKLSEGEDLSTTITRKLWDR